MRNGQNNKRMRNRNNNNNNNNNNRRGQNPMTRVFESNGPDIKIRGTASHVAEKYVQLARDAQASGDPVAAENYYQHAEHYFRLIAAVQEQFRQNQPNFSRPESTGNDTHGGNDAQDETFDEGDEDGATQPAHAGGDQPPQFGTRDPQPYLPRDVQFYSPRGGEQQYGGRPQQGGGERHYRGGDDGNVDRLPSFITGGGGGQPQQQHQGMAGNPGQQGHGGQNGYDNQGGDRFHRRRRRHRGPRNDMAPRPMETDDVQGPQGD